MYNVVDDTTIDIKIIDMQLTDWFNLKLGRKMCTKSIKHATGGQSLDMLSKGRKPVNVQHVLSI